MPAFDELGALRLHRRDGTSSHRPDVLSHKQPDAIRRGEAYAVGPRRGITTSDGPVLGYPAISAPHAMRVQRTART